MNLKKILQCVQFIGYSSLFVYCNQELLSNEILQSVMKGMLKPTMIMQPCTNTKYFMQI